MGCMCSWLRWSWALKIDISVSQCRHDTLRKKGDILLGGLKGEGRS